MLTPWTPARDSPIRTSGSEDWRSGARRSVGSIYAPKRTRGESAARRHAFSKLVSLACHDLRTPLATVYGFARTISRAEGPRPDARLLLGDDRVGVAAARRAARRALAWRRGSPAGATSRPSSQVSTSELAAAAAERLGDERVGVSGAGADVTVDVEPTKRVGVVARPVRAPARRPRARRRRRRRGRSSRVSPITPASAPVVLGEDLRDLGAAVAVMHARASGRLGRRRRRHAAPSASGLTAAASTSAGP